MSTTDERYRIICHGRPPFAGLLAQQLEEAGCQVTRRRPGPEVRHDQTLAEVVTVAAAGGAAGATATLVVKGSLATIKRVVERFREKRNVRIDIEDENRHGYL